MAYLLSRSLDLALMLNGPIAEVPFCQSDKLFRMKSTLATNREIPTILEKG
jgi:hypothetical protein